MYLLPKIHKRLYDVPERLVISNCGNPLKRFQSFFQSFHHLKPVMQEEESYIKDTGDFLNKCYTRKCHFGYCRRGWSLSRYTTSSLEALREALDESKTCKAPTGKLVKMAEFVLKNNYFQFSDKVYQQISGTAIGTSL